jgi:hypothetical protein
MRRKESLSWKNLKKKTNTTARRRDALHVRQATFVGCHETAIDRTIGTPDTVQEASRHDLEGALFMSRWSDAFENQQGVEKTRKVLTALNGASTDDLSGADRAEFDRAVKVLPLLEARFSTLDPEIFSLDTWNRIAHFLNVMVSQVQQMPATSRQALAGGVLSNINSSVDEILKVVGPIDIKFSPVEAKSLTGALTVFREKADEETKSVKKQADDIRRLCDAFADQIAQAKIRLTENDKTIASQKGRLDEAITAFQKQFSDAQEARRVEFLKALTDLGSKFKDEFDKEKDGWTEMLAGFKSMCAADVEHIERRKSAVDDLFGAIGSAALGGNFNQIANDEKEFANRWRVIAFGFFCAMGVVAVISFALTFTAKPDWHTFLFRLGTVIVLSIPAVYAANESSKHREREKVIRKNFLELSAIDAYIVHLPIDKQNEIKGKLSEKFFGVPEPPRKGEPVSTKSWLSFVEKLVKDVTSGGH